MQVLTFTLQSAAFTGAGEVPITVKARMRSTNLFMCQSSLFLWVAAFSIWFKSSNRLSGAASRCWACLFAEFERAMIRQRLWPVWAKSDGTQLGRRRLEDSDADKVAAIVAARAAGTGIRRIARDLGVGVGTVLRLTGEVA
jgi:hypothetical protein